MPTRSKTRRSNARVYETKSDPKQTMLTPQNRTVTRVLRTPATASISKERQETLTQIGYVVYQTPEDLDLTYEDDGDNITGGRNETPPARKRRKILKDQRTPVTRQTRSATRRAVEHGIKNEEDGPDGHGSDENQMAARIMLPPQTPQTSRRKVVPSSQSPADTPLSTQSQRSASYFAGLPLKERSRNIMPDSTARKSVRWAQKLEVSDSMECDDEEGLTSGPDPQPLLAIPIKFEKTSRIVSPSDVNEIHNGGQIAQPQLSENDADSSASRTQNVKSEVSDSEAEDDGEEFSSGADTQAAFTALDTQFNNPSLKEESMPSRSGTKNQGRVFNNSDAVSFYEEEYASERDLAECSDQKINSIDRPSDSTPRASQPQNTRNPITPYQYKPAKPFTFRSSFLHSESEEVSLQLENDLHSHTQSRIKPETESRLRHNWHDHEPAPTVDDEDPDPSSQDHPPHLSTLFQSSITQEPRLPLLPSRAHLRPSINSTDSPLPSSTAPVPTSQATTVDITQSPSAPRASQQLFYSPQALPPPPFLFSSSPLLTRAAVEDYAEAWDGVRLTDSQLLPDSLMSGTLIAPPALDGEGWEYEGE